MPAWKHVSPGLNHSIIQHTYTEENRKVAIVEHTISPRTWEVKAKGRKENWKEFERRESEVQDQGSRDKRTIDQLLAQWLSEDPVSQNKVELAMVCAHLVPVSILSLCVSTWLGEFQDQPGLPKEFQAIQGYIVRLEL